MSYKKISFYLTESELEGLLYLIVSMPLTDHIHAVRDPETDPDDAHKIAEMLTARNHLIHAMDTAKDGDPMDDPDYDPVVLVDLTVGEVA